MADTTTADGLGRVKLPSDVAVRFGLRPGAPLEIEEEAGSLRIRRPVTHLAKLYIEPTVRCNLACRTCMRNVWDEPGGDMSGATFAAVIGGLRNFGPAPTVFFGGFGEPLAHPGIVDMVAATKALGCAVELITNGVLLTEPMSRRLIAAQLDRLWVSLDGARPESYADVRLGATLPSVLKNVQCFSDSRPYRRMCEPYQKASGPYEPPRTPDIGIAFVAMRRNIADLPQVLDLGRILGAARYLVTNVLPYTPEMCDETLYDLGLSEGLGLPSPWAPHVDLPKMDVNERTAPVLHEVLMRSQQNVGFARRRVTGAHNRCPFIDADALVVGAEGGVSPCLPLLHDHTSYLNGRERHSHRYLIGNLAEDSLGNLWHSPEHLAFRQRVRAFDFSPCTDCGGCELSLANEEDCFGSPFPTCGGCLWAQGVIRCP